MDDARVQFSNSGGTVVYGYPLSHISTERNIDSPPRQYVVLSRIIDEQFELDQTAMPRANANSYLANSNLEDSASINNGENLIDAEADQSNDENIPRDNIVDVVSNTGPTFAHHQPTTINIPVTSAINSTRLLSDKHLVWLKYFALSFIGMFGACVILISLQMAFQLKNANAVPTVSTDTEKPNNFESTDEAPLPFDIESVHPDAKLLCEKIYKGYWSEKFNKCFILSKKPKLFEDAKSDCANPKGWKLGYPNDAEEKKLMGQIYKHLFKKATEGSEGDIQVEYSSKFFLGFVKSGKICRSIDGKVDLEDNPEFPEAGPACEEDSGNSFGVLDIKNYQFQFSEDDEDDMKHYLCTFDGLEFKTDHYYY